MTVKEKYQEMILKSLLNLLESLGEGMKETHAAHNEGRKENAELIKELLPVVICFTDGIISDEQLNSIIKLINKAKKEII